MFLVGRRGGHWLPTEWRKSRKSITLNISIHETEFFLLFSILNSQNITASVNRNK